MTLPFYRGESILEIMIKRLKSDLNHDIPCLIATTKNLLDDEIENIANNLQINCFRGPENDVMLRFIQAAEVFGFNRIIRVCADNPLFDFKGTMILDLIGNKTEWDYIGYKLKNNKPTILTHSGFWGEVVSLHGLKKAHQETTTTFYKEHVTNYIYQNDDKFKVKLIDAPDCLFSRDDIRLTVDTKEDFRMMQEIYSRLLEEQISLVPETIIDFIDANPNYLIKMRNQIEANKKV